MTPPVKSTPPYVNYGRIVVEPEANFDPASFKTLVGGDYRIVFGCPKGEYEPSVIWVDEKGKSQKGKCRVSRRVHSVLAPTGRTVTFASSDKEYGVEVGGEVMGLGGFKVKTEKEDIEGAEMFRKWQKEDIAELREMAKKRKGLKSPDRITEDESGQFHELERQERMERALGQAIGKGRLPPVGEMGMGAPKLEQSRIRELNDIMDDMLDFLPPEAVHLSRSVFEKDVRKALGPGFTEEEIDYIIVHLRARLMAEMKGKGRAMASPNGERQEFYEDKWANVAIKHGVQLTVEEVTFEPFRIVTFRKTKTGHWFCVPYEDIFKDESVVEEMSKNFDREWETRIGQYMESPAEDSDATTKGCVTCGAEYCTQLDEGMDECCVCSGFTDPSEVCESCQESESYLKMRQRRDPEREPIPWEDLDAPLSDRSKKWLKYGAIAGGVVVGSLVAIGLTVQYMYLRTAENIATAFAQAGRK